MCGSGSTTSWVTIEVTDDGAVEPVAQPRAGTGHGLLGMRERVALYGGSFEAAPRLGGGFRVLASLPMRARAS